MAVVLLLHASAVCGFESSTRLLPVQRCARKHLRARNDPACAHDIMCLRAICASAPSAITHAWRLHIPAGCEGCHAPRRHRRWGGNLVPAGGRLRRDPGANLSTCDMCMCMSTRGRRNCVCQRPRVYASTCVCLRARARVRA